MHSPTKSASATLRLLALAILTLLPAACAAPRTSLARGESAVLIDGKGVAIGGLDPVSYFSGDRPSKGDPTLTASQGGATYRFSSSANREAFLADPQRFVPAYGGWCAWAVADGDGSLVEVDPRSFLIQEGRLLLFYDGILADTRALWMEGDADRLAQTADQNWQRILKSSEE